MHAAVKNARITKPKKKTTPKIKTELLDAAINGADSEEVEDEV
jgi:hypothetical protein